MAEPTLIEVFGENALQDATTVTLAKADYATLTAATENTAESLFVGMMLKAATKLNTNNQAADPDIQVTIDKDSQTGITRNSQAYIRHTYIVNLDVPDLTSTVDPDSF
jgi:predicted protein tyrosine phosphatase